MVLLLGSCPFPERVDLRWFSTTLAGLGPRFHSQAVRAALCIPGPSARTAAVLEGVEKGGVVATLALDELRPVIAGGDGSSHWPSDEILTNQVGGWVGA